jgi:hypothetical protein
MGAATMTEVDGPEVATRSGHRAALVELAVPVTFALTTSVLRRTFAGRLAETLVWCTASTTEETASSVFRQVCRRRDANPRRCIRRSASPRWWGLVGIRLPRDLSRRDSTRSYG